MLRYVLGVLTMVSLIYGLELYTNVESRLNPALVPHEGLKWCPHSGRSSKRVSGEQEQHSLAAVSMLLPAAPSP